MSNIQIINADCLDAMREMDADSVDAIITDPPYGLDFMGKEWDGAVPGAAYWREALRVAKPGAHLLCFGGTRTFHRMTCAIEDAGWEIRDCIMWVYGSGFPKSMDVGKAIDKADGYVGEVVGTQLVDVGMQGGNMHAGRESRLEERKQYALSAKAQQWKGWGTCLKPAWEPIIMARKPLDGTVAHNVMEHGTGAINIDACRVATDDNLNGGTYSGEARNKGNSIYGKNKNGIGEFVQPSGRFPANLVHDGSDEVGELMGDAGRYFYCAKASKMDRGEGNDHPTVKPNALMRWLVRMVCPRGGHVLDPFMGSGSTGLACIDEGMDFTGIERDAHYCEIAQGRMDGRQMTLFGGDAE